MCGCVAHTCAPPQYSILNTLTVMFHSHASAQIANVSLDGTSDTLTSVILDILQNPSSYGGVITSITCTLLYDIMNASPQSVATVHESGLGGAFTSILSSGCVAATPELIMAIPNVIAALSLTEASALKVAKANPFPSMLRIFYSPEYAMPRSRALQGDMAAIFGTGVDEVIRHVPSLRPLCIDALVGALKKIIAIGEELKADEQAADLANIRTSPTDPLINRRTAYLQYVSNFSQLLEQILNKAETATSFISKGGIDLLLDLYQYLLPTDRNFLSNLSCMSNFSIAHLAHFSPAQSLTLTLKSIAQFEAQTVIKAVTAGLNKQFSSLAAASKKLRNLPPSDPSSPSSSTFEVNAEGVLNDIPRVGLHLLPPGDASTSLIANYSLYLKNIAIVEWHCSVLSYIIRNVSMKSDASSFARIERWHKELTSNDFETVFKKIAALHRSTQLETCRVRTEESYREREEQR